MDLKEEAHVKQIFGLAKSNLKKGCERQFDSWNGRFFSKMKIGFSK